MKSAICITAYKEFDYLKRLVEDYAKEFDVFIHVDSKAKCDLSIYNSIDHVTAVSKYKVNWGSYTHILAVCELIELALNAGNEYISIISANTVPTRSVLSLKKFFEEHRNKIFMEVKCRDIAHSDSEFEYRYNAYYFQHIYNLRGKFGFAWGRFEKILSGLQRKFFKRKDCSFDYKGYLYCHMPSEVATYVIQYVEHNPKYIRQLKYCYVGEEFFFQNIIMNSLYKDSVVKDCLIFDRWIDGSFLENLSIDDYDDIASSHKLFCRKVPEKNQDLYFEKLKNLLNDMDNCKTGVE